MTQGQFIKEIREIYDDCVSIVERKNNDYAADHDPFKNFRFSELAGVSVEKAIIVRMLDKMSRISNLIENGKEIKVKDESVEDTLKDLANYSAILISYLRDTKNRAS